MNNWLSKLHSSINGIKGGALFSLAVGIGLLSPHSASSQSSQTTQTTQSTQSTQSTQNTQSTAPPAFVEQALPSSSTPRQTVKDMVETVARLDSADAGVLSEVSRHQQVMVEQRYRQYDLSDNVSGIYMGTPEEEDVGPALPPRKRWIDYHVQQLQNLLGILSSELNSLAMPPQEKDSKKAELRAQFDVAHDSEASMLKDLATLKSLTVGPTYDNAAIAKVANHFKQELAGVNSVRKRLIRLL